MYLKRVPWVLESHSLRHPVCSFQRLCTLSVLKIHPRPLTAMIASDEAAHQDASHQRVSMVKTSDAQESETFAPDEGRDSTGRRTGASRIGGMDAFRVVVVDVFSEQPS